MTTAQVRDNITENMLTTFVTEKNKKTKSKGNHDVFYFSLKEDLPAGFYFLFYYKFLLFKISNRMITCS